MKIFCRCSFFLPGWAKDLPAPLYLPRAGAIEFQTMI
jgi:hypothetical protein